MSRESGSWIRKKWEKDNNKRVFDIIEADGAYMQWNDHYITYLEEKILSLNQDIKDIFKAQRKK